MYHAGDTGVVTVDSEFSLLVRSVVLLYNGFEIAPTVFVALKDICNEMSNIFFIYIVNNVI